MYCMTPRDTMAAMVRSTTHSMSNKCDVEPRQVSRSAHPCPSSILGEALTMRAQNTMLVALIAASCLLLGQARSTNAQTADKNAASATIQELKEEWVKTLRRAVEVLELQYREGVADFSRVGKAQSALTEALIEVARSREERIELLTTTL